MAKDKNTVKGAVSEVRVADAIAAGVAAGAQEPNAMRDALLKSVETNPGATVAADPVNKPKPAPLKMPPVMNGRGPAGIRAVPGGGYSVPGPVLGSDWAMLTGGRQLTEAWGYFLTREGNVRIVGKFHQMPAISACSMEDLLDAYSGGAPLFSILGGIPQKFNDPLPERAPGAPAEAQEPAPVAKNHKKKKKRF